MRLGVHWTSHTIVFRHYNERESVSNHHPRHCFLKRLIRRTSKKILKLRVTGLCAGNSPATGEFTAQRASNADNVPISWRHPGRISFLPMSSRDSLHRISPCFIRVRFLFVRKWSPYQIVRIFVFVLQPIRILDNLAKFASIRRRSNAYWFSLLFSRFLREINAYLWAQSVKSQVNPVIYYWWAYRLSPADKNIETGLYNSWCR